MTFVFIGFVVLISITRLIVMYNSFSAKNAEGLNYIIGVLALAQFIWGVISAITKCSIHGYLITMTVSCIIEMLLMLIPPVDKEDAINVVARIIFLVASISLLVQSYHG